MEIISIKEIPAERLSELLCDGFDMVHANGTTFLHPVDSGYSIDLEQENVKAIKINNETISFYYTDNGNKELSI